MSRPRLIETGKFDGCRDRDQSRLGKRCRYRDSIETLADLCDVLDDLDFVLSCKVKLPKHLGLTPYLWHPWLGVKLVLECAGLEALHSVKIHPHLLSTVTFLLY